MIYRVEFRADGSLLSCSVVESTLTDKGLVIYQEADSKVEACQKAKSTFDRVRKHYQDNKVRKGCRTHGEYATFKGYGGCPKCAQELVVKRREQTDGRAQTPIKAPKPGPVWSPEEVSRGRSLVDEGASVRKIAIELGVSRPQAQLFVEKHAAPVLVAKGLHERRTLSQCLREYDRDPAHFRSWLLARLGKKKAVDAE